MSAPRRGIALMVLTTLIFAVQDGISRHLAENYNTITVVLLRYVFFALFVIALSTRHAGGVREAAQTEQPLLQIFRGVLLAAEILVTVYAFTLLGLIETHAIFACYPLLVAALSRPVLGERVGWRRWAAIGVGFVGMLIILQPGVKVFAPEALIALVASAMFALYALLTRFAARKDSAATSFFYTGVSGAVALSLIGPFFWAPMEGAADWAWMGLLCVTGAAGHYTLIKAYDVAEASVLQPFAYFQLVFASLLAMTFFAERLEGATALGASLIVAAGLYTAWREHRQTQQSAG
ncbi:MAG: DMT family transporter [Pseudomonadota bacterium]